MSKQITQPSPDGIATTFNFYSLKFTPLANTSHDSASILHKVITYLSDQRVNHKGVLIDRHDKRLNGISRELFMVNTVLVPGKRIRGTIALLRSGKTPLLKPAEKFQLVPLDKSKGSIAEQTTFFIDYSKSKIIVCVEYNYNGPRASDIEFYFRSIAHYNLHISRATEFELFMENSIEKTLSELQNVLSIDIKMQPSKLNSLDYATRNTYFTGMGNLADKLKPKFMKIQTVFQTVGKKGKSVTLNTEANTMFSKLLSLFKSKPENIETFDSFVVRYEDKEGMEQIFNLLKGKYEFTKELSENEMHNDRLMFNAIETEFNEFMSLVHA